MVIFHSYVKLPEGKTNEVSLRASPTLLFRTVIGEMKAEGVNISWFFKQKIMWTELQKQVLETTLIGS